MPQSPENAALDDESPLATAKGFAVLSGLFNATYPENSPSHHAGDSLGSENFHLTSGTAEIQFYSGTLMTIEGPAEISLKSAGEASCHKGAVRMKVPPAARGFKLHSPSSEIIDLGTEFGLVVKNGEPNWQIRSDGKLMLSVMVDESAPHPTYPKSRFHHVYFSPPVWELSMSGQRLHITSVYDPAKAVVSHFIDGEKVSSETIAEDFEVKTLRIGNGEIGNWGQPFRQDPNFTIRNLNGRMDELAVFKNALSDVEINSLYKKSRSSHR